MGVDFVWGEKSHIIEGPVPHRIVYWGFLCGPWFFGVSRTVDEVDRLIANEGAADCKGEG